jgi:hypothetical protein
VLAAHSDGAVVRGVSTFLGGVSNKGSISAGHIGIEFGKSTTNAFGVSSVVGSIVNSGTITAKTGITLFQSIISGAIVDSGSIKATSRGILINSGSKILAGDSTAIDIAGPTFTGGITYFGVISGSAGIEIKSAHAVSIFDAGAILAASGGTAIAFVGSGNTLTLGAGYTINAVTNLGIVLVNDDSALTLLGTIKNSGTIFVDNVNPSADVHLFIDTFGVTLQGGGKVQLSNEFCNFITGVSSVTGSVLFNVDNTISGQGVIGSNSADDEAGLLQLINGAKGVINGNGTFFIPLIIATPGSVVINSGTLEGTNSVGLAIDSDVANSKLIGALGSGAKVTLEGTVTNFGSGSILASGSGAHVVLSPGVVSGGTLKTSGSGAVIEADFATANTISGVTIASGSLVKIDDGATLTISGTINNSGAIEVDPVAVSGALLVGSSSATLQGGGRVIMGGSDAFSGTLFVSSGGQLVAAINFVGAYSTSNFTLNPGFLPGISGTVIRDPVVPNGGTVNSDTVNSSMPHSGIDLPDIAFGAHTTLAYTANPAGTGGTLTVSDGRHTAAIALLGNYMAGSFVAVADGHGGTLIKEGPTGQPLLTHPPHG